MSVIVLGGRCLPNADFKGYRADVAARVGGSVRLDKGQGNFWGFTVFGGQDRVTIFQRSTAVFDGILCCHIGCADQRGGKGTVDGYLQRFVGGQGDVFGRNDCRGVCGIAQFHRDGDGHGVGDFRLTAVDTVAVTIVVVKFFLRIAVPACAGGALVYRCAIQHGVILLIVLGQGLPPYGLFAPILQQVRHLAAGKLFCRFGGDACDGTAGTVGKVVTVGVVARTVSVNLGGSV